MSDVTSVLRDEGKNSCKDSLTESVFVMSAVSQTEALHLKVTWTKDLGAAAVDTHIVLQSNRDVWTND